MPPEVLAWALLFVVAFAVLYRAVAWVGHRLGRRRTLEDIPSAPPSGAPVITSPAEPSAAAPSPPPSPAAPLSSPPPQRAAMTADVPRPAPARDYASAKQERAVSGPADAPPPLPASSRPAMPVGASAVMAARLAAASSRTALAPSVAATLPPFRQPSVAATLAPRTSAPVPASRAAADVPAATIAAPAAEIAKVAAEPIAPSSADEEILAPSHAAAGYARNALFLRAWRLGSEVESLDLRLRDARDRRTVQIPKTARGFSELPASKELKVLAPKPAPERTPARRIGTKAGEDNVLASAKAQTRIIGAPPKLSRVLTAAAL